MTVPSLAVWLETSAVSVCALEAVAPLGKVTVWVSVLFVEFVTPWPVVPSDAELPMVVALVALKRYREPRGGLLQELERPRTVHARRAPPEPSRQQRMSGGAPRRAEELRLRLKLADLSAVAHHDDGGGHGVGPRERGEQAADDHRATLETMTSLPVVLLPGEDGWLVAECPVLPGCISQGRTREEALANIREAIELCLESGDVPRGELVDVTVAA